jgi:hypothetical protein
MNDLPGGVPFFNSPANMARLGCISCSYAFEPHPRSSASVLDHLPKNAWGSKHSILPGPRNSLDLRGRISREPLKIESLQENCSVPLHQHCREITEQLQPLPRQLIPQIYCPRKAPSESIKRSFLRKFARATEVANAARDVITRFLRPSITATFRLSVLRRSCSEARRAILVCRSPISRCSVSSDKSS